jgi:hypothetical protein
MLASISIFEINGDPMPTVEVAKNTHDPLRPYFSLSLESGHGRMGYGVHCKTIDQLLDLGYAIIAAVNKIKEPAPTSNKPCPTCKGFGVEYCATHAPADAEPAFVPFAINDAVEHDEAMKAMGYERLDID